MKQKLGLTCALVHAPKVVLLDEPTTGVDPVSRREFWQILYGLRAEGAVIVLSTAYLDEADRWDRLALLHDGRLSYCEAPDALRARMPGAMAQIPTPNVRAARDVLGSVPGVRSVLMVGDGVRDRARAGGRYARADPGDADPALRAHGRQDDSIFRGGAGARRGDHALREPVVSAAV